VENEDLLDARMNRTLTLKHLTDFPPPFSRFNNLRYEGHSVVDEGHSVVAPRERQYSARRPILNSCFSDHFLSSRARS